MANPLAYRLKSARQRAARAPQEFEIHELLRRVKLSHPQAPVVISVGEHHCGAPLIVRVTLPKRGRPAVEVVVNAAHYPPGTSPAQIARRLMRDHERWITAHPFVGHERGDDSASEFLRAAGVFAAAGPARGVPPEYLAYAAGCIRRGAAFDAVIQDYFGVPAVCEALSGGRGRLRLGPLSYREYQQFLPTAEPSAGEPLVSLAYALLGPVADLEVVLVLKANEVPRCVPGSEHAVVGLTAWPRPATGRHTRDVEQSFDACEWQVPP